MKYDPQKIPDDLVERAARAMQGLNAIGKREFKLWDEVKDPERGHWLHLAKGALLAVSIHMEQWPELKLDEPH